MFTKRQYQILAVLSGTDSWISSLALSEAIGIGKRTIQTEIRKINEEICRRKLPEDVRIRSNNRKGYFLADPSASPGKGFPSKPQPDQPGNTPSGYWNESSHPPAASCGRFPHFFS